MGEGGEGRIPNTTTDTETTICGLKSPNNAKLKAYLCLERLCSYCTIMESHNAMQEYISLNIQCGCI